MRVLRFISVCCCLVVAHSASSAPTQDKTEQAPSITKVEPPNWWINLTPELMILLSGHNLQATKVSCNLPSLAVTHTQATARGDYLFIWLKIGANTKSGTAVCRATTSTGEVSFELPLSSRAPSNRKFQGLSQSDVIYLIMPDRFANGDRSNDRPADAPNSFDRSKPRAYHGGDLRGIREHLSYLKDLGVTVLWLTPVLKNGAMQDYHGYGAIDLYAVDAHLGNLKDYQELVEAAHERGVKIFFDAVPNHIGPNHPWVENPPLPDWFHGTLEHHANSSTPLDPSFYGKNNQSPKYDPFETLVDPHASPALSKNLTQGWFFGVLPDLNTENPAVAQYLLQNSIWWTETSGLDGFRLDTFPYIPRKFWAAWHSALRRIYPNLTSIGEVFHADPSVTSFFVGGQKRHDGVDSGATTLFDYPLYFVLRNVLLRGAPVGKIADVLRHDSLYQQPDSLITFFGNHDVERFASSEGSSLTTEELAFGLIATLRGIPQFYYGDEIGMPGGNDPDNRRDFPGGWSNDSLNGFTVDGRKPDQQKLFTYVQTLLRIRREHVALARGHLWHLFSDDTTYVFGRDSDEEKVIVAFNNSTTARSITLPLTDTSAQGTLLANRLFGEARSNISGEGQLQLSLPPQSLSIFLLE